MSEYSTQPQCAACWMEERGTWEGNRLVSYPRPVRVMDHDAEVEQCCTCGRPTLAGIFVRKLTASVPYPRAERDEEGAAGA